MPAAFIRHGSPLNTLERNRDTDAWRVLGGRVPRNATAVTARAQPRTIHDPPA